MPVPSDLHPRAAAPGIDVDGIDLVAVQTLPRLADGGVPAPALWATLESIDTGALDDVDALEVVAAWHRLEAASTSRRLEAMLDFAERPYAGTTGAREFADDELALRLRASRGAVDAQLVVADRLRRILPSTRAAFAGGRLDLPRVRVIADACAPLDRHGCAEVERRVLERAPLQNPSRLRQCVRRAVIAADPVAAERRCARARDERRVHGSPLDDGMYDLYAQLPADDWLTIDTALRGAARGLKSCGDPRTMDQLRADCLVAPFRKALATGVLDGAEPLLLPREGGEHIGVQVVVSAETLVGLDDRPALLRGYGPIPAGLARRLATGATWRRLLTEPASGAVVDVGTTRYRPPASMDRLVVTRDGTCRFPGCTRRAVGCDLDHTVPFPAGPTSVDNLGALCRRHHRLKHEVPGLFVEQHDGTFFWRMPTGHEHRVDPDPPTGSEPPDDR